LREREREFNQAEHLARALATALRLPLMAGEVRRVEATRTQTKLTRGERDDNMRRAFALAAGGAAMLRGKRVILVDDVLTTGSTTSACARVMREAGARDVCVWTLARGLLH
jgi:ComF family protein